MAGDNERLWLEIALRDQTSAGKEAILKAFGEIKAATAEAGKASGDNANKMASELAKVGTEFGSIGKIAAGVFGGITLAGAVKDLKAFHTSTMDTVAGLGSLADRFSVTTDQLQAWQGAARRANVTSDELNKTVFTFNQNVGQANAGNKQALEAFDKLGIKIRDSHGQLRPLPDLLAETARNLLQVENGSNRAALGAMLLGDKGARLTPLLRELGVPIEQLVDRGKSFGEIVDREIVDKLDRAKNASEAADQQFKALYATVAAPLHTAGLELLTRITASLVRNIREGNAEMERLLKQGYKGDAASGGLVTWNPAEMEQKRLGEQAESLRKTVSALEKDSAAGGGRLAAVLAKDLDTARAKLGEVEAKYKSVTQTITTTREAASAGGMIEGLGSSYFPPPPPPRTTGASSPPPTGGGSGADKRDRIGEALNQLRLETAASQAAYDQLRAGYGIPLEQLEREVALRKKIADEIAKLGKYDPQDRRVEEIKEKVRADEAMEARTKSLLEASRTAVEVERRMGDGRAYLRAETTRLNEALDTGRLSYDAYANAMREASEKAEDMRLRMLGQRGGIEGLVAGMQFAARQWERQNTTFEIGGRIYEKVIDDMISNTAALEKDFLGSLGKMALGWGKMLLDMELRAAASNVWNSMSGNGGKTNQGIIGGLASSLFDSLFGSSGGTGAGGSANASYGGSLTYGGPRAGGGDVMAGKAYMVGEREPEWFVPRTSGTILNGRQAAALGGGGGARQIVNIYNQTDAKVSTRESALPGGGQQLDVIVTLENALANRAARGTGALSKVFESSYGLQPVGRRG